MKIYDVSVAMRKIMNEDRKVYEPELVSRFLYMMSANHRIKKYEISQDLEHEIGADWLWVIYTNFGISSFLVQAKKLYDKKQTINLTQIKYGKPAYLQIETLLDISKKTSIPALYILFSNEIKYVPCGVGNSETIEGVFVDSAIKLYNYSLNNHNPGPKHMPISCMFYCFSKKCNYHVNKMCKVCKKCKKNYCKKILQSTACPMPFKLFMKDMFDLECRVLPMSNDLLLLTFAESVLKDNPDFVIQCIKNQFDLLENLPRKIVITDYMSRHDKQYSKLIMGQDFEINETEVCDRDKILKTLIDKNEEYRLFKNLGLFGSYAKDEATPKSDIDIALIYNKNKFKDYNSCLSLLKFVRDLFMTFHKNIDFVDFDSACKNNRCFADDINKDIIWILKT